MLNVQMLNAKCKMMYASIELSPFGIHGIWPLAFDIWHLTFGIWHSLKDKQ
jgi:hypothetical protein